MEDCCGRSAGAVSTWVSRPADGVSVRWHLEIDSQPRAKGLVVCACGRTFIDTESDPIERREGDDDLTRTHRCADCQLAIARTTYHV